MLKLLRPLFLVPFFKYRNLYNRSAQQGVVTGNNFSKISERSHSAKIMTQSCTKVFRIQKWCDRIDMKCNFCNMRQEYHTGITEHPFIQRK